MITAKTRSKSSETMRIKSKTVMDQMNAEKPDDVLADLEAKHGSQQRLVSTLPSWLFIDAVRYCIGRQSYQVGVTTEWLCANWKHLPEHSQQIIMQDIEEAFERDDRMRADEKCSSHYYPLGQDMDRKSWETVRALWRAN